MIRNILVNAGYHVVGEATNGADALNLYTKLKPDIVIMDITMPGMGGIQATHHICKQDPQAKVIMCSSVGHQFIVKDAIQAGAKDFIVKPFNKDQVMEVIKKIMNKNKMS
jgi:two-component system, chemotaxis family, chemotaxis protein CheY